MGSSWPRMNYILLCHASVSFNHRKIINFSPYNTTRISIFLPWFYFNSISWVINWPIVRKEKRINHHHRKIRNVPFIDFMLLWLSEGCEEDVFELGVVDTVDVGELGLMMSLIGVVLPPWFFISSLILLLLLLWCSDEEFEWLVTFCWAIRSCFRNFARRFWNQTWKKVENYYHFTKNTW